MTGTRAPERILNDMIRVRVFERHCAELQRGTSPELVTVVGGEAIAAGIVPQLTTDDSLVVTHREHGTALIRGVPAGQIMAEMLGRDSGCSGGRGGSMHLLDVARHFYGGKASVGSHLAMATGMALADVMLDRAGRVTACFFDRDVTIGGEFHEAMRLASSWNLPVLFCCENPLDTTDSSTPSASCRVDLALRAAAYGMPAWAVDAVSPLDVVDTAGRAIQAIRGGGGPVFLDLRTHRHPALRTSTPDGNRSVDPPGQRRTRDPIDQLAESLSATGEVTADALDDFWVDANEETRDAIDFAEASAAEALPLLDPPARAMPRSDK